jgi:uncharacterized membrane protein
MRQQTVTLRIVGGRYRDEIFTVHNYLSGQPGHDLALSPGDTVLVSIEEAEGERPAVFIEDFARDT